MGETADQWKLHRDIEKSVPDSPGRIGYTDLQRAVAARQSGRVKRAVSTLVALNVLQWEGMRRGRAVSQGPASLDDVLTAGVMPMPEREIATYPLLTAALDAFITEWHVKRKDPIDSSGGATSVDDGVCTYGTSSLRANGRGHDAGQEHTRPDLTVIVDLEYAFLGSWNDVHAVEVKPYWAVTRSALFEAAAQAALGRCTFSWLLAWVPDPGSGHFSRENEVKIDEAARALDALRPEAEGLGIGFIRARSLGEDAVLELQAAPRRRVMDPGAANELFRALGRRDSSATSVPTATLDS